MTLYLGHIRVSSLGVADDTSLLSNSILGIKSLLTLAEKTSNDLCLTLVPEKTNLIVFAPKFDTSYKRFVENQPLCLNGKSIPLSDQAEYVGLLRSSDCKNSLTLTARIAAHQRALYPILACGAARRHRGNPASSLRAEILYAGPCLYSGLASLILNKGDIETIMIYQVKTFFLLKKLCPKTPRCFSFYLSSSLPHRFSSQNV